MRKFTLLLGILFFVLTSLFAQDSAKKSRKEIKKAKAIEIKENVEKLLTSKDYIFVARHANPMSGGSINLSSQYDLEMKGDSVRAYLPFYGVAYKAELHGEGGIKFDKEAEEYSMKEHKGKYEVSIAVDAPTDNYRLTLVVTYSGYATLHVGSDHRQSISFSGIIDGLGL